MEIRISWKTSEALYSFPAPQVPLENLSLEETGESNETFQREGEEWKRKVFRLGFKTEKPGIGKIGAFRLNYIDPELQKGGFLNVPARTLKVRRDLSRLYPAWVLFAGTVLFIGVFAGWLSRARRRTAVHPVKAEEAGPERHYLSRLQSPGISLAEAERHLRAYLKEAYPNESEGKLSLKESKILEKIGGQVEEARFAGRADSREEKRLLGEIIRFIESRRVVVESPDHN